MSQVRNSFVLGTQFPQRIQLIEASFVSRHRTLAHLSPPRHRRHLLQSSILRSNQQRLSCSPAEPFEVLRRAERSPSGARFFGRCRYRLVDIYIYTYIYLYVCLFICRMCDIYIHTYIYLYVCLFICRMCDIYIYIYAYIYLFICLFIYL